MFFLNCEIKEVILSVSVSVFFSFIVAASANLGPEILLLLCHLLVCPKNVSNAKRQLQLWSSEPEMHTAGKTCIAALLLCGVLLSAVMPHMEHLLS